MANDHDDDDDDLIWTAYTKGIKPIGPFAPRVSRRASRVMLRPRAETPAISPLARQAPPPITTPDRQTQRKLKRGTWDIAAEIDLHGMTQTQAHGALLRFMQAAIASGHKCVRIITGKGGRSSTSAIGVLRQKVPQWLQEPPLRDYVVSLHNPPPHQGGAGATIVILRKVTK